MPSVKRANPGKVINKTRAEDEESMKYHLSLSLQALVENKAKNEQTEKNFNIETINYI